MLLVWATLRQSCRRWAAGNNFGYGVLLAHSFDQGVTFMVMQNVSRYKMSLHAPGAVEAVLKSLLRL